MESQESLDIIATTGEIIVVDYRYILKLKYMNLVLAAPLLPQTSLA